MDGQESTWIGGFPLDWQAATQLLDAGWCVSEFVTVGRNGSRCWVVSGSNGNHLIRADGATKEKAWLCAVEQARSLGMVDRSGCVPES